MLLLIVHLSHSTIRSDQGDVADDADVIPASGANSVERPGDGANSG
jgi:hypothetical protein